MSRLFVVIPAAGHSRRMGCPKLLLPWGEHTVVEQVLRCFDHPAVAARVVVVRPTDTALASTVRRAGGIALQPEADPPEMRDSVQLALDWMDREFHPAPNDGWILSPADHPLLVPDLFRRLVVRWNQGDCGILVPEFEGKRGHPVFFRWDLADEVARLPADQGLNALVRGHADDVVVLPVTDPGILVDLDTPADYDRLRTGHPPPTALNPEREQV